MSKTLKIIIILGAALLIIGVSFTIFVNSKIESKVKNFIANRLPENISQSYENIDINSLEGTITLNDVVVKLSNINDTITHTKVTLDELIIENVSYWDYVFNDIIHIEDIKLKSPNITYYKDKVILNKDTIRKAPIVLYKPILIDELSIDNTTLTIFEKGKDNVLVHTANTTIEIDDLLISKETLLQKIPVSYKEYEIEADSIFVKISPHENVTVGALKVKDKQAQINNVQLKTKYSRKKLSRISKVERDHIKLITKQISIADIDFGFTTKEKLYINSSKISFDAPVTALFRDKLVADDYTPRNLYSKMLRDTPVDLNIAEIAINNGALSYTERVKEDNSGGTIRFNNLNATILNASNTYDDSQQTDINVQATFMKDTPFKANWVFDINDKNDQFHFNAEIGKMTASDLNTFMEPNLKVNLEGEVNRIFFTINGTNTASKIDMRMSYKDFEVNILNKVGKKKNRFLSAIANVFIKKTSKTESGGFREGEGTAERDTTKSFFNYLWLNISSGLLDTLTGKSN